MTRQLPLPLSLHQVNTYVLAPALALFPSAMDSRAARVLLLAIGLQESRFNHRRQVRGPARGLWQFEKGGGVAGVLNHPASRSLAALACREAGIPAHRDDVYPALEKDDILAARFARLLLWTDAKPLPAADDVSGGWDYYIRTWRPGKPHRHSWDALHRQAQGAVR